jgi:hypothetical protein
LIGNVVFIVRFLVVAVGVPVAVDDSAEPALDPPPAVILAKRRD